MQEQLNNINHKLKEYENKKLRIKIADNSIYIFTVAFILFLFFTMIEALFNFSSSIRTGIFFIYLFLTIGSIGYFILIPFVKQFFLLKPQEINNTALEVGCHYPEVKDNLINVLQLVSSPTYFYSQSLILAAFNSTWGKIEKLNFSSVLSYTHLKKKFFYGFSISIISLLLIILIPSLSEASKRILNFNEEFLPPQRFYFQILPGDGEVLKGNSVEFKIKTTGVYSPTEVFLNIKDDTQSSFDKISLRKDSTGIFSFTMNSVRNGLTYFVNAEEIKSRDYRLEVVDPPVIILLSLKVIPPAYTGLSILELRDNGSVEGLFGSTLQYELIATKELKSAKLVFDDNTETPLNIESNKASLKTTLKKNVNYFISITDKQGNKNLQPIIYNLTVRYDLNPEITLISPRTDVNIGTDFRLPIFVKIKDDFGFNKLLLHYRLSASRYDIIKETYNSIEIPLAKGLTEADINYIWNLTSLSLATQDVVSYYLEVFDNDNISGPKSARTQELRLRVPSLEEIFAQVDEKQNSVEQELVKTLNEAEELKKMLDQIDRDLKQDKKQISWEEKEKIEQAMKKFEELQQKVEETSKMFEQAKDELQKNDLLSKETMEKYLELQELFNQLSSEEMKKAMERLQNQLQNLDRKQIQQAFQDMQFNEEQFKKSLERTINLLKRLQVEQKMDELQKRLDDISSQQEKTEEQTKNANDKQSLDNAAKQQEDITKKLKQFEKAAEELKEQMKDLDDMPKEEMDKLMEEMDKQNNEDLSEQASSDIKKMQKQSAQQKQQQLNKNMQKMKDKMSQMQAAMQQKNQMQTFAQMFKMLENIISLSKQQEELRKQIQNSTSPPSNEQIKTQDNIRRNLDKLLQQMSELSQKTFAITPEMGKALGDARRQMNSALEQMQNRNNNSTQQYQAEAMGSLNQGALLMKGMMEQMMQGNGQGGGGMMSLMQQLGQLSQQQMGLNNMTQMLQQAMQQGSMTGEQLGQLQRLAQQQELIRKSLEQLHKEAEGTGKSKSMAGNLEKILKQMEEVVTNMKTEKLDDELVQKQERILSKLLDAQKSVNERDYEKERESNTGVNIVRKSPSDLQLLKKDGKRTLRDELNNAGKEGYTKDYEQLIRKYYESLEKEVIKEQ